MTDAEHGLQQAQGVVLTVRNRAERQIAQLEQQLRDGAHPGVAVLLAELSGLWDQERREGSWNAPTRKGVSMPAQERIEQIRAIRAQAEALQFEPDPAVAER